MATSVFFKYLFLVGQLVLMMVVVPVITISTIGNPPVQRIQVHPVVDLLLSPVVIGMIQVITYRF